MTVPASDKKQEYILRTILGILVAGIMVLACTPPFSRDALIHHLQIPKLYLQHGGIYEIPDLIFSYYPMNLDLLYMGALHLGNDILAKYIHMAFGLATAILLYLYLKKRLSSTYGYLGTIFFLSIPIIVKLSITIYVDLGLVFFSTASLLLLFRWLETRGRNRYLLLAGICCGLCIGTKYNGLLVLFILTFMVPVLFIRSQTDQAVDKKYPVAAVKAAILFCFAALMITSPWLIRNTIWTGNPMYPLYNGLFNPTVTEKVPTEEAKEVEAEEVISKSTPVRGVFAKRYVLYRENIWQLLLLPVRIFFEGQDGDPRYFDGRLNPFLFLLPLISFLGIRQASRQIRLEKISLAAFSLFYFLFAFNTGVLRIRYLVPMVPFLVILSMYGLSNMELKVKQYVTNRKISGFIQLLPVVLLLIWNGSYIYQQFQDIKPFSYINGDLSRDEYLSKRLPEYKVMRYANKNLPASSNILCVFTGWRGYYLDRKHLFDHQGNQDSLLAWLKNPSMTSSQILQRLNTDNINYLIIRTDLFAQWLTDVGQSRITTWVNLENKSLTVLFAHNKYLLYKVTR